MATYSPDQLGIKPPSGGFQQGGWYSGRQYWNGSLSDPGVIHQESNQQGAGQKVSAEVNAQSAAKQGVSSQNFENYLQQQRQAQQQKQVQPVQQTSMPGIAGAGSTGAGAGLGLGTTTQSTINLPDVYNNLYKNSGISDIEKDLSLKTEGYNKAISQINDNPFLSEATRVGRVQKLTTDFNNSVANVKNDIATKKADIETQLNLQTKQYDINSDAAQKAISQFNSLLASGALEGASGEDIAAITRSTGISSSMIQSAVNAKKQKDINTSTISYDDGTNQGFAIINSNTGEIISKQVVAASKPKAASTTGGLSPTQSREVVSTARTAITSVDTNEDMLISAQEYIDAVNQIMVETGVDQSSADNYAAQALADLGYSKWRW